MIYSVSARIFIVSFFFMLGAIKPVEANSIKNVYFPFDQNNLLLNISSKTTLEGAQDFIDDVAARGIGFLGDEDLSESKRAAAFQKLLEDSFDTKTIGRFALGRYWRSATEAQQKEYLKLFNDMIVDVYTGRFSEYDGQALRVVNARAEGKSDILVESKIIPAQGSEIQLDWRVRNKNGTYKIIDVIVEGVSMALTQRSDFSSVIQRGGGDIQVLLDHLKAE